MITDKKINKTFNRCINRLKQRDENFSSLTRQDITWYVAKIKQNKNEIIAETTIAVSSSEKEMQLYEENMLLTMVKFTNEEIKREVIPEIKKDVKSTKKVMAELERLVESINQNHIGYNDEQYNEWGGANVVVTSDKSWTDVGYGRDFVLITDNPQPIVWLMITLRDICEINYLDKYEFYYMIAKSAKSFIDSDGLTIKNQNEFFLSNIHRVKKEIITYLEQLQNSVEHFDEEFDEINN